MRARVQRAGGAFCVSHQVKVECRSNPVGIYTGAEGKKQVWRILFNFFGPVCPANPAFGLSSQEEKSHGLVMIGLLPSSSSRDPSAELNRVYN